MGSRGIHRLFHGSWIPGSVRDKAANSPGMTMLLLLRFPILKSRSRRSQIELDPLRQWQRIRPVNRVCLPPHVGLPRVGTGFASAAGFLLAAERAADLGAA